ncbi:MAG: LPS assembly lipoprotein LptE [Alphaproteobacteria bacterium]
MIRALPFALALAVIAPALSGCGFTPVYGPELKNSGSVSIPEIEGRTGHFLRQELVRTVGRGVPGVTGSTELEIKLVESIGGVSFAPDQAASRSDYIGKATWTLRDPEGKQLAGGIAKETASFNVANLPYADISAQTAAQQRLADLLARSIRDQLLVAAGKPLKATTVRANEQPDSSKLTPQIRGVTVQPVSPVDPVDAPPFKQ